MSYTEEAVRAKLSALNESTDSIVSVAQWIMFHRSCSLAFGVVGHFTEIRATDDTPTKLRNCG